MKKLITSCGLLFVLSNIVFGETPKKEWDVSYREKDRATGVPLVLRCDHSSNVYITGKMSKEDGRDSIVTVKYDNVGQQKWVSKYEAESPIILQLGTMQVGSSGDVFITGNTFNNFEGKEDAVFLVKYGSDGRELWRNHSEAGTPRSVLLVTDEAIYVGEGGADILCKYNLDGKKIITCPPLPKRCCFYANTIFEKNEFIYIQGVGGTAKYTMQGELVWSNKSAWNLDRTEPDTPFYVKRSNQTQYRIEKKDENNKLLWKIISGDVSAEWVSKPPLIGCDTKGNLYIAMTVNFKDKAPEILLSKISKEGKKAWEIRHKYDHDSHDTLKKMLIGGSDSIYLLGYNQSKQMKIDFGASSFHSMAKYDTNGKLDWSVRLGLRPELINVTENGDIYIFGPGKRLNEFRVLKYSQSCESGEIKNEIPEVSFSPFSNLSKDEKAYAKRMYDHLEKIFKELGAGKITKEDLVVSDVLYESDMYKKWGLGPKKEFTLFEKYYLMQLPMVERTWHMYSSIDLKNLTSEEQAFLDRTATKYGKGKINMRDRATKQHGQLEEHQIMWFDLIKAVIGSDTLDKKGLAFLYRITPK